LASSSRATSACRASRADFADRRLVRREAEPVEAVEDLLHRLRVERALSVSSMRSRYCRRAAREEEVEQRGRAPADVQDTGGGGGEAVRTVIPGV
jgi:hypothetical protein